MYYASVLLLTLILPLGSVYVDQSLAHNGLPLMLLIGKWFAFWAGGVRLFIAGVRQIVQPRFTSQGIFGIASDDPLPFVRELGMANVAMSTLCLASVAVPTFLLPGALVSGLYYAFAGIFHVVRARHGWHETVAMVSDFYLAAALLGYAGWAMASYL
jgi:hypothetical protein